MLDILSSPTRLTGHDHLALFAFLLELYSYRGLTSSLTPFPGSNNTITNPSYFLGSLSTTPNSKLIPES